MKKSDLPKPKYNLGDYVRYYTQSEGNQTPRWKHGSITSVKISVSTYGKFVQYGMSGEEDTFDESIVKRR